MDGMVDKKTRAFGCKQAVSASVFLMLVFAAMCGSALGRKGKEDGWRPVPVSGTITVERSIYFKASIHGARVAKQEKSHMIISVEGTVEAERAGARQLFTEGAVVTDVEGHEVWDIGDRGVFTHTYHLSGEEPFGAEPKLAKQRVYLEVNEDQGLFFLKVPGGRAKGPCVSTVTVEEGADRKISEIVMELSVRFPDGPGQMRGTYDPAADAIQGQFSMTGYQLPGGPAFGEKKFHVWAQDDPDLPKVMATVGKEKMVPVNYTVHWNLSVGGRDTADEPPMPQQAQQAGQRPVDRPISTEPLQIVGERRESRVISADTLQMTGLGAGGDVILTKSLRMSGLGSESRIVRTRSLRMIGSTPAGWVIRTQALDMTGLSSEEGVIHTDLLHMTGLSGQARRITTEALHMIGVSRRARIIRTGSLGMTGLDPEARVIRADGLRMTGLSDEERIIRTESLYMTGLGVD